MALEDLFCSRSALRRYRLPPLGSEVDEFCEWLRRQGYCRRLLRRYVRKVSRFNQYLRRRGIKDCREVEGTLADLFLRNHLTCYRRGACSKSSHLDIAAAVHGFQKYLSSRGILRASLEVRRPYQELLEDYLNYLKCERNLAEITIKRRQQYLVPFLEDLGADGAAERLCNVTPERVQAFFEKYTQEVAPTTRQAIVGTLRTFFRFAVKQGYLNRDLTQAVPRIRSYNLSHLPRGLSDGDAQKVLDSIDRTTGAGPRDFAIIQLLYTYGVRGGHIRALRLPDIQWRQNRIRFPALKGGKEVVEPLTNEVGEALLEYLRHGRPHTEYDVVFLTARVPFQPLRSPANVSSMVAHRMRQAGVSGPPSGSHTFRHAFAMRMLKHGQSLKTIADMLGHRHINTTFIYTKVDLETLTQLPLDWPEVSP